jgi:hypothetical protein
MAFRILPAKLRVTIYSENTNHMADRKFTKIIDTICRGCDLPFTVNDLGLCDDCFMKLERALHHACPTCPYVVIPVDLALVQRSNEAWLRASGMGEVATLETLPTAVERMLTSDTVNANIEREWHRSDFYKKQNFALHEIVDMYRQKSYIFDRIGHNPLQDLKSWQIPLFSFDTQRVFDGAILVGDAGQFVNQITGDGIYEALFTGRAAVQTIIQAMSTHDFLASELAGFDGLWRNKLGKRFKEAEILNNLATLAPNIISRAIFHTDRQAV